MAELNKYSMYNLGFSGSNISQKDKVEKWVDELIPMNVYGDVKNFIQSNFGEISGDKWFDYPELKKQVYVVNEPNKIEICMLKNGKQFYGKGWVPYEKQD